MFLPNSKEGGLLLLVSWILGHPNSCADLAFEQGLTVYAIAQAGVEPIDPCLSFPSARIKGVCHHRLASRYILKLCFFIYLFCMLVHTHTCHGAHVEVRRQLGRVSFLSIVRVRLKD